MPIAHVRQFRFIHILDWIEKMNVFDFKPKFLTLAIFATLFSGNTFAQSQPDSASSENKVFELEQIEITAHSSTEGKTENEITGLGKVHKSNEDISKNQILNIRDLTRYDPGISVVEQGRGASSGYAIRGVDKNRVGIFVDGIPQAQSYLMRSNAQGYVLSGANGGSINEIEFENIRSVELSKGASSAEYGNGALGGAVGFRTKNANDIIQDNKNWGVQTKSAYTSKNQQWTNSIATAGKTGGFEGLAIYTHRQGKETKSHKAINDLYFSYRPLTGFVDAWDVHRGNGTRNNTYFLIQDNCPNQDCTGQTPSAFVKANYQNSLTLGNNALARLTDEARQQYEQMNYKDLTVSANDYTGADRISPNPMDYQSQSFFLKGAYQFNPAHRLEAVAEHAKQRYDIRDMTEPAYFTVNDIDPALKPSLGVYEPNAPILMGLFHNSTNRPYSYAYTRAKFYDEHHKKTRFGLNYRYQPEQNTWADHLNISFNHQKISLDSLMSKHHCSLYPIADKHCRPTLDKLWSVYHAENNVYHEQHNLLQLQWDKRLDWLKTTHNLQLLTGLDQFRSDLERKSNLEIASVGGYERIGGRGTFDNPHIYRRLPTEIQQRELCKYDGHFGLSHELDCRTRSINGHNYFISLRNQMNLNDYLDWGLGVRFDQHRFKSADALTHAGTYRNWSWNSGIVFKPFKPVQVLYRISNGFRVPAFYELYGVRDSFSNKNQPLDTEKSFNQELGIAIKYKGLNLESSYFNNRYRDLITRATILGRPDSDGFYNLQNVRLHGIAVTGRLDWSPLLSEYWQNQPAWLTPFTAGLYHTFAYNHTKIKDRNNKTGFTNTTNAPVLDAIQPARYVFGMGYDAPNEKWGLNWLLTYSKAKENDEVNSIRHVGFLSQNVPTVLTRKWYTHDLTGYANLGKYATLRAGVYNLFNYKYSTWEAVRQSSVNAVNQDRNLNGARFAAPGRNFSLALELKF